MEYFNSKEFAQKLDDTDSLKRFRDKFYIPFKSGIPSIYLCGNSLGLQPKSTLQYVTEELQVWQEQGVEGHFHAKNPWFSYHKLLKQPLANLVGALPSEVVAMNNLTTNLHLMMVSFYRPDRNRHKIIIEAGAFPSDQYAVESQVRFHGFDPEKAIIEIAPRDGEFLLRKEDILETIKREGKKVALVLFSGIQYYTGQFFDIKSITQAAHEEGAVAGFDLAHAVGNVPLKLHDWGVDFAVWCSYKYLNSGPGATAGTFIHEKYADDKNLPRFAGWWGHNEEERFLMKKGFKPITGADGWQLSNSNILSMASVRASLDIFEDAGIDALRQKSIKLTGYLEYLISLINQKNKNQNIHIVTPANQIERGCQLSMFVEENGKMLFNKLQKEGIVVDYREPNVIRVAPAPLYNSFLDVYKFAQILDAI